MLSRARNHAHTGSYNEVSVHSISVTVSFCGCTLASFPVFVKLGTRLVARIKLASLPIRTIPVRVFIDAIQWRDG